MWKLTAYILYFVASFLNVCVQWYLYDCVAGNFNFSKNNSELEYSILAQRYKACVCMQQPTAYICCWVEFILL